VAKEQAVDFTQGDALPLGSRVRLRRQARGVRLSEMAKALGYDRGYLSRVETGKATPSEELVEKIAGHLGTSAALLREGALEELVGASAPPLRRGRGTVLSAPPLAPRKRALSERIERLVAMAHLSPQEEEVVADRLVAVTGELLALIKAARSLR
jgi:XRE family transcriptional regulator, fatty acid utilization regulator